MALSATQQTAVDWVPYKEPRGGHGARIELKRDAPILGRSTAGKPESGKGVKAVLPGIRRTMGAAADRKNPATGDVLTTMLALHPATLAGHPAGRVADPTEVPNGLRAGIRRGKTGQGRQGQGRRWRYRGATGSSEIHP